MIGGILWYANRDKQVGPVFDPVKQFVPKNARAQEVGATLAQFGFPKPLPFFDKDNVVQSITNTVDISTSTIHQGNSPYLSYRICGQNIEAVRTALINYFENTDWKTMKKKLPDRSGSMLTFSANSAGQNKLLSISFFELPQATGKETSCIVTALRLLIIK